VKGGVDLVNKAGGALTEIVESIKQVAAIVSEIANASAEQATGIEQVNKALNQMDEVTQQNSALVEENAATAKTLEQQAKAMDQRVASFRIDETEMEAPAPKTVTVPELRTAAPRHAASGKARAGGVRTKPVAAMRTTAAAKLKEDTDWTEF